VNASALVIFLILFVCVTVIGFYAARWHKADLSVLSEWGLAGRRLGTLLSWFLIGGDLYTAYTFIAVPALAFGSGALAFFAVPYTIVIYPFIFVIFPRFWSVAKAKGYITASDYVKGRFESRGMALAVAVTGIIATLPYIALQLVGMQAVLQALGFGSATGAGQDVALVIAFAVVAFEYQPEVAHAFPDMMQFPGTATCFVKRRAANVPCHRRCLIHAASRPSERPRPWKR